MEDPKKVEDKTNAQPADKKPDEEPKKDDGKKEEPEKVVPYSQFEKVYARLKTLEEDKDKLERDQKTKEEEKMKENQQYKELLDKKEQELNSASQKASKLESVEQELQSLWEETEKTIPEDKRSLVPESLSPLEKIKYVNKNRAYLLGTEQPKKVGDKTPKSDKTPNSDENEDKKARYDELTKKARENEFLTFQERRELAQLSRELAQKK